MTADPRFALGVALSEMCGHPIGESVDAGDYLGGGPTVQAFANVIALNLPSDWCGHAAIVDALMEQNRENARVVDAAYAHRDDAIRALADELSACNSGVLDLQDELRRLREVERAAVEACHKDDDYAGEYDLFVDLTDLRTALGIVSRWRDGWEVK